jgi:hypothetical protein
MSTWRELRQHWRERTNTALAKFPLHALNILLLHSIAVDLF